MNRWRTMNMNRINVDQLQEMLKSQSQADCARYFNVSEAAICKAVKRLNAAVLPASMDKLTRKEKDFAMNLSEGKSPTESAMKAYDCKSRYVAKTIGCRMAKDPDISTAVSDLMAQEGIPKRRRIQRLGDLIESNDLSAVSRGLDMSWKLTGEYAPEKIDAIVDYRSLNIGATISELRELLAGAKTEQVKQCSNEEEPPAN